MKTKLKINDKQRLVFFRVMKKKRTPVKRCVKLNLLKSKGLNKTLFR